MYEKVPPHSQSAEQALLSICVNYPEFAHQVFEQVNTKMFYVPENEMIAKAIVEILKEDKTPELKYVYSYFQTKKSEYLDSVKIALTEIVTDSSSPSNIAQYAYEVVECFQKRQAVKLANDVSRMVNGMHSVDDILSKVSNFQSHIDNENTAIFGGESDVEEAFRMLIERTEEAQKITESGKTMGIDTGFPKLNDMTGGWQKGNLIVLGARPAMGKTTFGVQFAYEAVKRNVPTYFVSLEMDSADLISGLVSGMARIYRSKIRDGRLTDSDWKRLTDVQQKFRKFPLSFNKGFSMNTRGLITNIRRQHRRGKAELVIIDYLQLIEGSKGLSRVEQISEMTRELKKLALELKIPIILLSQLNRVGATEAPMPHHLKESGSIEQDADIILMPHREMYANSDGENDDKQIDLFVRKNRRGAVGEVKVEHNGEMSMLRQSSQLADEIKAETLKEQSEKFCKPANDVIVQESLFDSEMPVNENFDNEHTEDNCPF